MAAINYLDVLALVYQGPYSNGTFLQILDVEQLTYTSNQQDGMGQAQLTIRAAYESQEAQNCLTPNRVQLYLRLDQLQSTATMGASSISVSDGTRFVTGKNVAIYDGVNFDIKTISSISGNTINLTTTLGHTYSANASVMPLRYTGTIAQRQRDANPVPTMTINTMGYCQQLANFVFEGDVGQSLAKECGYVMFSVLNSYASQLDLTINSSNFVMSATGSVTDPLGTEIGFTGSSSGVTVQSLCDDIVTTANANTAGVTYAYWVDEYNVFHFGALPTTATVTFNVNGKPTPANSPDGICDVVSKYVQHDQDITGVINTYLLTGATNSTTNAAVQQIVFDQQSVNLYTQIESSQTNSYITDPTTLKNWGLGLLAQTAFPIAQWDVELSSTRSFINGQTCMAVTGFTNYAPSSANMITSAWTANGTFTRTAGAGPAGDYGWVITGTGASVNYVVNNGAAPITVTAGQKYALTAYVDATYVTGTGAEVQVVINGSTTTTLATVPNGAKGRYGGVYTVPAGGTSMYLQVTTNNSTIANGGLFVVAEPQITLSPNVQPYIPSNGTETYVPVSVDTKWDSQNPGVFTQTIKGAQLLPSANREIRGYANERYVTASNAAQSSSNLKNRFISSGCLGSVSGSTFTMTSGQAVGDISSGATQTLTNFAVPSYTWTTPIYPAATCYTLGYLYCSPTGGAYTSVNLMPNSNMRNGTSWTASTGTGLGFIAGAGYAQETAFTANASSPTNWYCYATAPATNNTTYSYSFWYYSSAAGYAGSVYINDSILGYGKEYAAIGMTAPSAGWHQVTGTFTTATSGCVGLTWNFQGNSGTLAGTCYYCEPQIQVGSTATQYVSSQADIVSFQGQTAYQSSPYTDAQIIQLYQLTVLNSPTGWTLSSPPLDLRNIAGVTNLHLTSGGTGVTPAATGIGSPTAVGTGNSTDDVTLTFTADANGIQSSNSWLNQLVMMAQIHSTGSWAPVSYLSPNLSSGSYTGIWHGMGANNAYDLGLAYQDNAGFLSSVQTLYSNYTVPSLAIGASSMLAMPGGASFTASSISATTRGLGQAAYLLGALQPLIAVTFTITESNTPAMAKWSQTITPLSRVNGTTTWGYAGPPQPNPGIGNGSVVVANFQCNPGDYYDMAITIGDGQGNQTGIVILETNYAVNQVGSSSAPPAGGTGGNPVKGIGPIISPLHLKGDTSGATTAISDGTQLVHSIMSSATKSVINSSAQILSTSFSGAVINSDGSLSGFSSGLFANTAIAANVGSIISTEAIITRNSSGDNVELGLLSGGGANGYFLYHYGGANQYFYLFRASGGTNTAIYSAGTYAAADTNKHDYRLTVTLTSAGNAFIEYSVDGIYSYTYTDTSAPTIGATATPYIVTTGKVWNYDASSGPNSYGMIATPIKGVVSGLGVLNVSPSAGVTSNLPLANHDLNVQIVPQPNLLKNGNWLTGNPFNADGGWTSTSSFSTLGAPTVSLATGYGAYTSAFVTGVAGGTAAATAAMIQYVTVKPNTNYSFMALVDHGNTLSGSSTSIAVYNTAITTNLLTATAPTGSLANCPFYTGYNSSIGYGTDAGNISSTTYSAWKIIRGTFNSGSNNQVIAAIYGYTPNNSNVPYFICNGLMLWEGWKLQDYQDSEPLPSSISVPHLSPVIYDSTNNVLQYGMTPVAVQTVINSAGVVAAGAISSTQLLTTSGSQAVQGQTLYPTQYSTQQSNTSDSSTTAWATLRTGGTAVAVNSTLSASEFLYWNTGSGAYGGTSNPYAASYILPASSHATFVFAHQPYQSGAVGQPVLTFTGMTSGGSSTTSAQSNWSGTSTCSDNGTGTYNHYTDSYGAPYHYNSTNGSTLTQTVTTSVAVGSSYPLTFVIQSISCPSSADGSSSFTVTLKNPSGTVVNTWTGITTTQTLTWNTTGASGSWVWSIQAINVNNDVSGDVPYSDSFPCTFSGYTTYWQTVGGSGQTQVLAADGITGRTSVADSNVQWFATQCDTVAVVVTNTCTTGPLSFSIGFKTTGL